ncbi:MAG: hypothetical protein SF053_01615 [Bacteroidia bacterium]|nr:hypothetical protein [Bacteroidia bacterium]
MSPSRTYWKSTTLPIYYLLDPDMRRIEVVKDWTTRPKVFQRYPYHQEFAQMIRKHYIQITTGDYYSVREQVRWQMSQPRARHDYDTSPAPASSGSLSQS